MDKLHLRHEVKQILQFPTDTIAIDYLDENGESYPPEIIIIFLPGNPGLVHWYIPLLKELVHRLGRGFAARGISYAGHGVTSDMVTVETFEGSAERDVSIAWTIHGQVRHKIAFIDEVTLEIKTLGGQLPRFIFLSHSIGCHLAQRICVLRPDILKKTLLLLHLMPFIRMDAPFQQQRLLNAIAYHPDLAIKMGKVILTIISVLPREWVDHAMTETVPDGDARDIAVDLVRLPTFARNFFELGGEEIRELPQKTDVSALRLLGSFCRVEMLFVGGPDHWAPQCHADDLQVLQQQGLIPESIGWTILPKLKHDFVVHPLMLPPVVEFCFTSIRNVLPVARL